MPSNIINRSQWPLSRLFVLGTIVLSLVLRPIAAVSNDDLDPGKTRSEPETTAWTSDSSTNWLIALNFATAVGAFNTIQGSNVDIDLGLVLFGVPLVLGFWSYFARLSDGMTRNQFRDFAELSLWYSGFALMQQLVIPYIGDVPVLSLSGIIGSGFTMPKMVASISDYAAIVSASVRYGFSDMGREMDDWINHMKTTMSQRRLRYIHHLARRTISDAIEQQKQMLRESEFVSDNVICDLLRPGKEHGRRMANAKSPGPSWGQLSNWLDNVVKSSRMLGKNAHRQLRHGCDHCRRMARKFRGN